MRYRLLGRSGLRVSELCLGTMTFGNREWGTAEPESGEIYARYRDAGGNFIDTANEIYAGGRSESIVGALVAGHRDEVVLATKFSLALPGGRDANLAGNHRKSLVRSVESSLRRLKTERIDLLWMHAWDGVTPLDEVVRALDDLVRQGKVLYLGVSNAPAWVVARCNTLAELRGQTPFVALQCEYSLVERGVERELAPMARDLGLAMLAWSPLAGGVLSGKYAAAATDDPRRLDVFKFQTLDDAKRAVAEGLRDVAESAGCSPAQAALAWLLARRGVIPVLGARTPGQLEDNLGASDVVLSAAQIAALDALAAPAAAYPGEYLAKVRPMLFGGLQDRIDF